MGELVHDLSNEIMVLQGWALLAQGEAAAGRPAAREVGRVVELATELGQMLRDVLGTVGSATVSPEVAFDPVALTEDVLSRRMRELSEHEVRFCTRLPEGTRVSGQASFWTRIVANLVSNALRYADRQIQVTLEASDGSDRVRLLVEDDGPGVPLLDRSRIFQPLWRGENGGTGLGLAAVAWLSAQLGGTVRYLADCSLGGAAFEVSVPVAAPLSLPQLLGEPRLVSALSGRKVLVIDDEPAIRRLLARLLGRLGADARELPPNGEPEERLIGNIVGALPDLILLDLRIHGRGGLALWRALNTQLPELASRVIFVSGSTAGDPEWDRAALTGQPMLGKPLDPHAFRQAILRVTDGR